MKFEYLYVVFFVLSLIYKWYKSTKENAESGDENSAQSKSKEYVDAPQQAGSYEDLISQFEAAYGVEKVSGSTIEEKEELKVKEPDKIPEPKVEWYKEESPKKASKKQSKKVSQKADKTADEGDVLQGFDLEQMVIASTILDRPYKYRPYK